MSKKKELKYEEDYVYQMTFKQAHDNHLDGTNSSIAYDDPHDWLKRLGSFIFFEIIRIEVCLPEFKKSDKFKDPYRRIDPLEERDVYEDDWG